MGIRVSTLTWRIWATQLASGIYTARMLRPPTTLFRFVNFWHFLIDDSIGTGESPYVSVLQQTNTTYCIFNEGVVL